MRKSIALLLAMFLFINSSFVVFATGGTERASAEEVLSIADRTVKLWYCATTFGKTTDGVFENWQPENFNYISTVNKDNQSTILRFAWASRMFFDTSFDYTQYEIQGGSHIEDLLYRVPKNIMLETIKKYVVCPNLSIEQLPFYDDAANAFVFTSFGGFGGGVSDKYWSLTKKSNGNWLAKYAQPGPDDDNTYPALEKFSVEMTDDYKVVSISLDVDIQSLQWKTAPKKTSYKTGEALNLDGATLKAIHTSGAAWEIPVTADMVSGYNPSQTGKQTIRVNYYNKSLDFQVTVQAPSTTSSNRPSESTTSAKPTDKPTSRPTNRIPTQTINSSTSEPLQPGITTVPAESESTSNESVTTPSENETSAQSTEKTQKTNTISVNTVPEKNGGFPLWGIILIVGIVVVAGGTTAVVILIKKGKISFLKK